MKIYLVFRDHEHHRELLIAATSYDRAMEIAKEYIEDDWSIEAIQSDPKADIDMVDCWYSPNEIYSVFIIRTETDVDYLFEH